MITFLRRVTPGLALVVLGGLSVLLVWVGRGLWEVQARAGELGARLDAASSPPPDRPFALDARCQSLRGEIQQLQRSLWASDPEGARLLAAQMLADAGCTGAGTPRGRSLTTPVAGGAE